MHAREITAKMQRDKNNICNKKPIEQKSVFNFREHIMRNDDIFEFFERSKNKYHDK